MLQVLEKEGGLFLFAKSNWHGLIKGGWGRDIASPTCVEVWQPDAPISPRHFLKKIFKNCLKKYLLTSLSRRCHSIWARFSCLGWLTNDFIRLLCIKGSTIRGVFLAKEMANHFLFSQCFCNFFFRILPQCHKGRSKYAKGREKKMLFFYISFGLLSAPFKSRFQPMFIT